MTQQETPSTAFHRAARQVGSVAWACGLTASLAASQWVLPEGLARTVVGLVLGGFGLWAVGKGGFAAGDEPGQARRIELSRGLYLGGYLCMAGGVAVGLSVAAWVMLRG